MSFSSCLSGINLCLCSIRGILILSDGSFNGLSQPFKELGGVQHEEMLTRLIEQFFNKLYAWTQSFFVAACLPPVRLNVSRDKEERPLFSLALFYALLPEEVVAKPV